MIRVRTVVLVLAVAAVATSCTDGAVARTGTDDDCRESHIAGGAGHVLRELVGTMSITAPS